MPAHRAVRFANPRAYLGQFDEARRLITDEYTLADDDASPENSVGYLINMGEIESIAGNFDSSIRFFEQAIEKIPGKEYDLEATNRGPWISRARQTHVTLALLHAYREYLLVKYLLYLILLVLNPSIQGQKYLLLVMLANLLDFQP